MYCGADSRIFLPRSSIHVYCLQKQTQTNKQNELGQREKCAIVCWLVGWLVGCVIIHQKQMKIHTISYFLAGLMDAERKINKNKKSVCVCGACKYCG
jgi:hypothetical protein